MIVLRVVEIEEADASHAVSFSQRLHHGTVNVCATVALLTSRSLTAGAGSARSRYQQSRVRAITCKLSAPNSSPTISTSNRFAVLNMPAAGDDLRKYLVVPSPSSAPSIQQSSSQFTSAFSDPASRPDTPRFHQYANRKAEDIRMEVDYSTQPPALASAHTGAKATITAPIEGVMSLDDFLANNQADHDAALAAREAARAPPAKKSKKDNTTTPPQPVAVGARSSKYTILLHEKHQALAIPQPIFTYGGDSVNGWSVEVSFPGLQDAEELGLQGIKEDGRFNSKQEAKEAVSRTAVTILEELEQAGRISKPGKAKKPKGDPANHQSKEKEESVENYVGQLIGTYQTPCTCSHHVVNHEKSFSAPSRHLNLHTPITNSALDGLAYSKSRVTTANSDLSTHSSAQKKLPTNMPPVARSSTSKTRAFGQKNSPTSVASESANPPTPLLLSLPPLLLTARNLT